MYYLFRGYLKAYLDLVNLELKYFENIKRKISSGLQS